MSKTLTFSKYVKLPLLWPRIISLCPMVEKLLMCQLKCTYGLFALKQQDIQHERTALLYARWLQFKTSINKFLLSRAGPMSGPYSCNRPEVFSMAQSWPLPTTGTYKFAIRISGATTIWNFKAPTCLWPFYTSLWFSPSLHIRQTKPSKKVQKFGNSIAISHSWSSLGVKQFWFMSLSLCQKLS